MSDRPLDTRRDTFKALADPTRRSILTLLRRHQGCSAGKIADAFPDISRPAVSRHLRVLREAGLVTAAGVGREQRYTLSLAGLARAHHDWFAQFDSLWAASLEALRERTEASASRDRSGRIRFGGQKKRR